MATHETDSSTGVAIAAAAVMIGQQVAAKATRDAIFLANFDSDDLLKIMLASALLSGLTALAVARGLAHLGPARLVPLLCVVHGAMFAMAAWLLATETPWAPTLLYLHVGALGGTSISGFWSVVNERFDPHTAKRVIGRIGGGATLGGVGGGVLCERVTEAHGVAGMLPVLAALGVAGALLIGLLGRGGRPSRDPRPLPFADTLGALGSTPLLRRIAILVVLTSVTSAIVEFSVKAEADASYASPEALGRFFAIFHTAVAVMTFVMQTTVSGRVLRRYGLGATIALLPAGVLGASLVGASVQRLWSAALAAGLDGVLRSSMFRSGYELLYTPMAPAQKRPTKAVIDVTFDRIGDAIGAGALIAVGALLPVQAGPIALLLAAATALLALLVTRRLHGDYVAELTRSLRDGIVDIERQDIHDATTERTLAGAAHPVKRDELLREIDALQRRKQEEAERVGRPPVRPPDALRGQLEVLAEGDRDAIGTLLEQTPLPRSLLPPIASLLDDPLLGERAASALERAAAAGSAGLLGDLLLDTAQPRPIRVRIARVLGRCPARRSVEALTSALDDPDFALRYHAGQALLTLTRRQPELAPAREVLLGKASEEVQVDAATWDARRVQGLAEPPALVSRGLHERSPHALEHVLTLLAVGQAPEPLAMCLDALGSQEARTRGTALEYLQNVLPAPLFEQLTALLPSAPRAAGGPRTKADVLAELSRSTGGG